MINWKLLYDKFGRLNAAKKFEDLALDYVCDVYNEYTWKPTQRTRDGNRDFHNLEEDLLKIWGEAKYKKDSISFSRSFFLQFYRKCAILLVNFRGYTRGN